MACVPRLHLISGKGGVGKTATATALAMAEVRAGARTLLVELNGRDQVSALLGVEPVGYKLREVFDDLWVVDINPHDAIHEYVLLTLRFETLYKAVFENRLVRNFIRLVPSLAELVMLGKVWFHAQEMERGRPRFDAIVVDAPATGHARALLRAPAAVQSTVPPGPMRENARLIDAMLRDTAHTQLHVVTTPEDMSVTEALELIDLARELGIRLGAPFINQRVSALPAGSLEALAPLRLEPPLLPVVEALERREAKRLAGELELARLPAELREQACSLPRLAGAFDATAVEGLATLLSPFVAANSPKKGGR